MEKNNLELDKNILDFYKKNFNIDLLNYSEKEVEIIIKIIKEEVKIKMNYELNENKKLLSELNQKKALFENMINEYKLTIIN